MSKDAYMAEIANAEDFKARSIENPDGVPYMDHVWQMIKAENDLSVVVRAGEELYTDVPIRAWWSHGYYDWETSKDGIEHNMLTFEIPDEISRRVQSAHANVFFQRFFGIKGKDELEQPFIGSSEDATRNGFYLSNELNAEHEVITDDWPRLKSAIEATAKDRAGYIGGQTLKALSTAGKGSVLARVNDDQFELFLPERTLIGIQNLWTRAFRKEIEIA